MPDAAISAYTYERTLLMEQRNQILKDLKLSNKDLQVQVFHFSPSYRALPCIVVATSFLLYHIFNLRSHTRRTGALILRLFLYLPRERDGIGFDLCSTFYGDTRTHARRPIDGIDARSAAPRAVCMRETDSLIHCIILSPRLSSFSSPIGNLASLSICSLITSPFSHILRYPI